MRLWPRPLRRAPPEPTATALASHRVFQRLQNSRYASQPEPDVTLSHLSQLAAHPSWVRLLLFNDAPQPWRLDGACVALTSVPGDGAAPLDALGRPDPDLWRRVTFGAGQSNPWASPLLQDESEHYGVELPGNPRESGRPVLLFSDWIALDGPPRRDGEGALLLVRCHAREGMRHSGGVGPIDRRIGLVHRGYVLSGNATVPPFAGQPRRDDTVFAAYGIEAICAQTAATVIGIGDSIIHSSCTTGELSGFGVRAASMVSAPARPVSYVNEGYPGRNSLGFCWTGDWMLRHLRPQVALIQTWTQNETWDRPTAQTAFARAIALADETRRGGGVPILVTAAPVFAGQPEPERHRAENVAMVRQAAAHGMRVLDLDRIWGTGASPNEYRPDAGCGDGMHPSDEGCITAARELAPMLDEILRTGR